MPKGDTSRPATKFDRNFGISGPKGYEGNRKLYKTLQKTDPNVGRKRERVKGTEHMMPDPTFHKLPKKTVKKKK